MKVGEKIEKYPECYSTELYNNYKDKNTNQKYMFKKCHLQFTLNKLKNNLVVILNVRIVEKAYTLDYKYEYHVRFKCNNKQCNYTIKQLIPTTIDNPSSKKLFGIYTFLRIYLV